MKNINDLNDCEKDKIIILIGYDESHFTGVFKEIDEDNIIIKSTSSKKCIGLEIKHFNNYFEEI